MSIETITEYIDPQLFIVVPMLWGIGLAGLYRLFCCCVPVRWFFCISQAQNLFLMWVK